VVALAKALGIERFIATGYSMGGLIAQLLWRRHPERTSRLVLCASSRNFLGTPAQRWASLFAPAFTVAVRMNPLWSALGAGILGPGLVNGLDGELRQFALAELNRTSMTTVAAALVAVSEFTSHEWIGQIDVPVSVLVTTHDTIVPAARQRRLAGAIPHATMLMVEGAITRCASATRPGSARSCWKRAWAPRRHHPTESVRHSTTTARRAPNRSRWRLTTSCTRANDSVSAAAARNVSRSDPGMTVAVP
jgi:hypothetical protein